MAYKFTRIAESALRYAADAAAELGHDYIGTEHILVGLLSEKQGIACQALMQYGVTAEKVTDMISQFIGRNTSVGVADIKDYTPRTRTVLDLAEKEAKRLSENSIGTEHILIALLRENECVATRLLVTLGVNIQKLYNDLLESISGGYEGTSSGKYDKSGEKDTSTLDKYSRDLTESAREGKLDPV
ncbi:MAG: ATP-dependent Clp protease ATP-binding subunit ClpC, partial [Lachnospiraceae bacterium]|nr:ATP-dependent Clp protease ATP-binding subunit ClpC [Lachnospiraceae bacterium]